MDALAGRTGPALAKLGLLGAPKGREGPAGGLIVEEEALAVAAGTRGPVGMIVFMIG
jgi:hypothetical protein